jgi:hypothetical protein
VVNPAINVSHAFEAAAYAACCDVPPWPAFFPSRSEAPGDVDVRVDPAGQDRQAAQVVIDRRGFRINRENLQAFDHDASLVQYVALAIEHPVRGNHVRLFSAGDCGETSCARAPTPRMPRILRMISKLSVNLELCRSTQSEHFAAFRNKSIA